MGRPLPHLFRSNPWWCVLDLIDWIFGLPCGGQRFAYHAFDPLHRDANGPRDFDARYGPCGDHPSNGRAGNIEHFRRLRNSQKFCVHHELPPFAKSPSLYH